jgi:DNA polymerase III epsilon subunit-like protein
MSFIVVDVESDGQNFLRHSMVCFGAVVVEPSLSKTFYGRTRPISGIWVPEALAISGFSREEHETFDEPEKVMKEFAEWIKSVSIDQPILISDNNGYDAGWINLYFQEFHGGVNPFGWSSRRIGDLYCGMKMDSRSSWKKLRKTTHDHNPVNDAKGNAEALLAMQNMGLKIKFE